MKKAEQFKETERKLMESYEKLLLKTSKISVDMICEEANLHHQTFYRHFKNKEEFISFFITTKLNNLLEANKDLPLKDTCINLLTHGYERADLLKVYMKNSLCRTIITKRLLEFLECKFATQYDMHDKNAIFFLVGGLLYYMLECINNNKTITLEEATSSLTNIGTKIEIGIKLNRGHL